MRMNSFWNNTEQGQGASPSNKTSVLKGKGSSHYCMMETSGFFLSLALPLTHDWPLGRVHCFYQTVRNWGLSSITASPLLGELNTKGKGAFCPKSRPLTVRL